MAEVLLFGGRDGNVAGRREEREPGLDQLLGWLAWKYVTEDATFDAGYEIPTDSEKLREEIAAWAGRVWVPAHPIPSGDELRRFDLRKLEPDFRADIARGGATVFRRGLSLEEIWASQQLHDAAPWTLVVSEHHADQPLDRVAHVEFVSPDELVWWAAALPLAYPDRSWNVLVTDGRAGHTISLDGLNGVPYEHPRGRTVPVGWFSFNDPWPARSLLAPDRGHYHVDVLEDVATPPFWLIPPDDLAKIIVAVPVPTDRWQSLDAARAALAEARRSNFSTAGRIWESEDDGCFTTLIDAYGGTTPTTVTTLFGLADIALHFGDLEEALDIFEEAFELAPERTARRAVKTLARYGHARASLVWQARLA